MDRPWPALKGRPPSSASWQPSSACLPCTKSWSLPRKVLWSTCSHTSWAKTILSYFFECGIWMRLESQMSKDHQGDKRSETRCKGYEWWTWRYSNNRVCDQCSAINATNVYFSMKEDGGSFDECGTTWICRLLQSEWLDWCRLVRHMAWTFRCVDKCVYGKPANHNHGWLPQP